MTKKSFFLVALASAVSFVENLFKENGAVSNVEHSIAKFGDAVVNEYKVLAGNPTIVLAADWFVKIAEGIDPALTPLISGIELEFPKIVSIATGVVAEVSKPESQQLVDGLSAIAKTKAANSVLGSNILGGIAAAVNAYVVSNNATELPPVTDAQLITAAQLVHAQVQA